MVNAYINTKTNLKKLQFGIEKCHKMHVGKVYNADTCPELKIDGWEVKKVEQISPAEVEPEDEYTGMHSMETVEKEKYLGDIISNDGKNTKNIAARTNRGTGVVNQIISILEDICFGKHYFVVAMILRNALLISSLLTNAEAWYNLTMTEITDLEKVDESLLRRVLQCPAATPKEMLYLELGVTPIRNIIRSRRLNFLHYILHEEKESLIYKFLKAQLSEPTSKDWGQTVLQDIEEFDMNLSLDDIEKMSEFTFQNLVKKKGEANTMKYLNGVKAKHSKVLHIPHIHLEMADYLKPSDITNNEARFLFSLRCRMVDVRTNFEGKYSDRLCPLCAEDDDHQHHLLVCELLNQAGTIVEKIPVYKNIFEGTLEERIYTSRIIEAKYALRKKILKQSEK